MGAFLFVLILLSLSPGQALASGLSSALAGSTTGIQEVAGTAPQSDKPPAPAPVQSTVAPVTAAVTQTVEKATEPVTEAGSTSAKKLTTPVSSTVAQSAGKTVDDAVAPVLHKATQTVGNVTAPVLQTVTRTVDSATAPVLRTAAQTVGSLTSPVLRTATQTVGDTTSPAADKVSSSPGPAPMPGVGGPPAFPSEDASAPNLTPSSSAPLADVAHEPPLLPGTATHLAHIGGPSSSSPFGTPIHWSIDPSTVAALSLGHRGTAPSASTVRIPPAAVGPPGGSSGSMASAAGMAFSTFLTLAGLLLMGGLAAMRLLRLASEPSRRAPFVLIPERPG